MMRRGTTPTIRYRFKVVQVEDMTEAWMTIKQPCGRVIEKTLAEAEREDNALLWTLTQDETLELKTGNVEIQCRWLLMDGTAGASVVSTLPVARILRDGVIA